MTRSSILRKALAAGMLAVALVSLPVAAVQAAPAVHSSSARTIDPIAESALWALNSLEHLRYEGQSFAAEYEKNRDKAAFEVAVRIGLDPVALQHAWASADLDHQQALLAGLTQIGVPYRRNTSKPGKGFDCSGLTTYAWGRAGFDLPRQSTAQINGTAKRTIETAQAGDLVQYPGHVMMWLGVERAILHSPGTGRNVEVDISSTRKSLRFGDPTG